MPRIKEETVIQWYQYFRDITSHHLLLDSYQISGIGHTVEIDESFMVKRKYNRSRVLREW